MQPTTSTKGILRPQDAARHIDLRRWPPGDGVGRYVERYWAVHWDLRGRDPYQVDLVPHPCVNVTVGPQSAEVHGVGTRTSAHRLAGAGWVFGVKFRPGGFAAYTGLAATALTDGAAPVRDVFGPAAEDLAAAVRVATDDPARVRLVETFLRQRSPAPDQAYQQALRIVATMLEDRTVTRVDQIAARYGVSVRTLQRLFRRYVGVTPKWVIRRYRIHDAAERLAAGPDADPAALAAELGWFDQAHFTREFTALIGTSPAEYATACAAAGGRAPAGVLIDSW